VPAIGVGDGGEVFDLPATTYGKYGT